MGAADASAPANKDFVARRFHRRAFLLFGCEIPYFAPKTGAFGVAEKKMIPSFCDEFCRFFAAVKDRYKNGNQLILGGFL